MKICRLETELFYVDGCTDGPRYDEAVTFHNFAYMSKKA